MSELFGTIFRIIIICEAVICIPMIYLRIKYMNDTKFVAFKAWTGVVCIGVANGSYYAIGRPFNPAIVVLAIGLGGLILTTFINEVKRRMGIGDCSYGSS